MSPVAELEPVVNYVSHWVDDSSSGSPASEIESFAFFICQLFEDLQKIEANYLASAERSREATDAICSCCEKCVQTAMSIRRHHRWPELAPETRQRMDDWIDYGETVVRQIAAGRAGRERFAEFFRNESA